MKHQKALCWRSNFISFPIYKLKTLKTFLWRNSTVFQSFINPTFVLNVSTTLAALPVTLININPRLREGWAIPNRAKTFAPAPSPNPITYFTCKKSSTVTKSSPRVFRDGNWKLNLIEAVKKSFYKIRIVVYNYESGRMSALSACPDTSTWMKHDRSLISVIHGLFTNSWNELWLQPKSWTVMNTALFSCWVRSPFKIW